MSKNTRLALILLGVYMLTWIMMLGFFTKENIGKETEVKTVAKSEKEYIENAADKIVNKETLNLKKTYRISKIKQNIEPEISSKKETYKNQTTYIPAVEVKEYTISPVINVKETNTIEDKLSGYEKIGRIEIPKTGLDTCILKNQTISGMELAPCLVYSKGEFNKTGFSLIGGHNYRNGKLFSNNNNINIGDKIFVTSNDGTRKAYTVMQKFVTTPSDVSFLKGTENDPFKVILQSCTDDESGRIIIIAE